MPIVLRSRSAADIPVLAEWMRPHQQWHEMDAPYFHKPSDADIDNWAERELRRPTPQVSPVPFAVIADSRDGSLLGLVNWYFQSRETNWRRMGIAVYDPRRRSAGIGKRAFALWADYLFRTSDVLRLDFATWSGNAPMLALGRSLGFVEEARFRKARAFRGGVHDSIVMGILREEWEPLPECDHHCVALP